MYSHQALQISFRLHGLVHILVLISRVSLIGSWHPSSVCRPVVFIASKIYIRTLYFSDIVVKSKNLLFPVLNNPPRMFFKVTQTQIL